MPSEIEINENIENDILDKIIIESLKRVVYLKDELGRFMSKKYDTRLIYPKYREDRVDDRRISEQEIKHIFTQVLNEEKSKHEFFYSVECPTRNRYIFRDRTDCNDCPLVKENPCPENCALTVLQDNRGGGCSGRVDLCLYKKEKDEFKRNILIEFKYKNPNNNEICQDFLKLAVESNHKSVSGKNGIFILFLNGFDNGTKNNLFGGEKKIGKFVKALDFIRNRIGNKILTLYILTVRNAVERDGKERTNGFYKIDLNKNSKIKYNSKSYTKIT